jgi:pimeloyl-ACP methyl ester carboxylesterase
MSVSIFKNEESKNRIEQWYLKFLEKVRIPVRSVHVETSYGESNVLLAGDDSKPPMVCLHSMLTGSALLLSEIEALSEKYYLILPDIPGLSARGLNLHLSYTTDDHSIWLDEILITLNIDKAIFLGVSLGGFVCRQFATNNPEKVEKLILIVPAGIVQGSVPKGLVKLAFPMIRYKIIPNEKNLRKLVMNLITTWDEDWAYYMGDAFNDFKPNLKIPPLATDEELNKISAPLLLIAAEFDISFPGQLLIDRVKEQIPDAECELIKDSRHSPPTTPEFRNWLKERIYRFVA